MQIEMSTAARCASSSFSSSFSVAATSQMIHGARRAMIKLRAESGHDLAPRAREAIPALGGGESGNFMLAFESLRGRTASRRSSRQQPAKPRQTSALNRAKRRNMNRRSTRLLTPTSTIGPSYRAWSLRTSRRFNTPPRTKPRNRTPPHCPRGSADRLCRFLGRLRQTRGRLSRALGRLRRALGRLRRPPRPLRLGAAPPTPPRLPLQHLVGANFQSTFVVVSRLLASSLCRRRPAGNCRSRGGFRHSWARNRLAMNANLEVRGRPKQLGTSNMGVLTEVRGPQH